MDIQDVLIEMRWCRWWPTAQGWADAIEAAMREKDAEISGLKLVHDTWQRKAKDQSAEIERLKAEIHPDWNKLEACQQSLREHMAEIKTLNARIERDAGLLLEHMAMVRERDAEIERLREVITEASEAMRDGSDSTAWAILVAALANKETPKT